EGEVRAGRYGKDVPPDARRIVVRLVVVAIRPRAPARRERALDGGVDDLVRRHVFVHRTVVVGGLNLLVRIEHLNDLEWIDVDVERMGHRARYLRRIARRVARILDLPFLDRVQRDVLGVGRGLVELLAVDLVLHAGRSGPERDEA